MSFKSSLVILTEKIILFGYISLLTVGSFSENLFSPHGVSKYKRHFKTDNSATLFGIGISKGKEKATLYKVFFVRYHGGVGSFQNSNISLFYSIPVFLRFALHHQLAVLYPKLIHLDV